VPWLCVDRLSRYDRLHFTVSANGQIKFDFDRTEAHLLSVVAQGDVRRLIFDGAVKLRLCYKVDALGGASTSGAGAGAVAGAGADTSGAAAPPAGFELHPIAQLKAVLEQIKAGALCEKMAPADEKRLVMACRELSEEAKFVDVAEKLLAVVGRVCTPACPEWAQSLNALR